MIVQLFYPKNRTKHGGLKTGLARNRLLFSVSGLVDKTQARTTLFRGRIPVRSLTEENVGDCAVVLPPKKTTRYFEKALKYSKRGRCRPCL